MTELKANLGPYSLEAALAIDIADNNDCFLLDVGHDSAGVAFSSLRHVIDQVRIYGLNIDDLAIPTKKLYITGEWHLAPVDEIWEETDESISNGKGTKLPEEHVLKEQEWRKASMMIMELIDQMPALTELTWISEFPFTSCVFEALPTSLTKLVLDLGQPVRLHMDGGILHKSHITAMEMKPLQKQTQLKELRLLNMFDSYQLTVWETVFRNKTEDGMRVLDLQMASAPMVRTMQGRMAKDVTGLTMSVQEGKEMEYKGIDGKGILHYLYGTGEYLDDLCIRKARLAAGLAHAKPVPLWCLKLDGFVIDHLPFEEEFTRIALLTCGDKCFDAGLRAPKTRVAPHIRWATAVTATSQCLIQWPNWSGVFDDSGDDVA